MGKKKTLSVLVTGASGFVGANLVRRFLQDGFAVHVIVRKEVKLWRLEEIKDKLIFHTSDLCSLPVLKTIVQKVSPDYIFHLAAYGAYSSQNDMDKAVAVNIVGLKNLLEASLDIPYKLFINTGSSSEYGFKNKPMRETDVLEPVSYYAATKASATLLSSVFAREHKKPVITFRLFSVFGPYEEPTRFIPTALKAALTDKPLSLTPGKIRRDFIYVDDVVDAYVAATNVRISYGDVFNIGTGKQYSNKQIALMIKKCNKSHLQIAQAHFTKRSWDTNYWVSDNRKAVQLLHWKPNHSIEQGLQENYQWIKKHIQFYT